VSQGIVDGTAGETIFRNDDVSAKAVLRPDILDYNSAVS
jgi:hypothetical protein